jgi:hypothetical protein
MVAILAPILDHARPGFACCHGIPEVFESGFRHVRMTQNVVRRAHQFCFGVAAGFNKVRVYMNTATA